MHSGLVEVDDIDNFNTVMSMVMASIILWNSWSIGKSLETKKYKQVGFCLGMAIVALVLLVFNLLCGYEIIIVR